MRTLVIGQVWPEPDSTAAGGHVLDLLRAITGAGWPCVFASAATPGERPADLAAWGVDSHGIRLNDKSFDHFVRELAPELVLFDRFMSEEQFGWRVAEQCPNALRVLDTEDLHSLRLARGASLPRPPDNTCASTDAAECFALMSDSRHAWREIAAIYRSDLSLLVSEFELALLSGPFAMPGELLHLCPLMLPPPVSDAAGFGQRRDFVCIGNDQHAPNHDCVLWLKRAIWPKLLLQLPGARLHIYGAYMQTATRHLHDADAGFLVHGWAPDADAVLARARVCLAPLRYGAGVKGKLLNAARCGTPSVTTPIGAEGIATAGNWPGAVAEDPDAIVAAAVRLHQDEAAWRSACQAIPALLTRHDPARISADLLQRLQAQFTDLAVHRQRNFIGSMLRHHRNHSSRYLAKWIEAKNRNRS